MKICSRMLVVIQMKKVCIFFINCYQILPLASHKMCRFTPSCSEYTKQAIERFGVIKGIKLGVKRILKCHPKGSFGYDAVPEKEKL